MVGLPRDHRRGPSLRTIIPTFSPTRSPTPPLCTTRTYPHPCVRPATARWPLACTDCAISGNCEVIRGCGHSRARRNGDRGMDRLERGESWREGGILGKDRRGICEVLRSEHDSTSCGVFSRQSITMKNRKEIIDARVERLGSFILESSFFWNKKKILFYYLLW